jgi:hypothetical protein
VFQIEHGLILQINDYAIGPVPTRTHSNHKTCPPKPIRPGHLGLPNPAACTSRLHKPLATASWLPCTTARRFNDIGLDHQFSRFGHYHVTDSRSVSRDQ